MQTKELKHIDGCDGVIRKQYHQTTRGCDCGAWDGRECCMGGCGNANCDHCVMWRRWCGVGVKELEEEVVRAFHCAKGCTSGHCHNTLHHSPVNDCPYRYCVSHKELVRATHPEEEEPWDPAAHGGAKTKVEWLLVGNMLAGHEKVFLKAFSDDGSSASMTTTVVKFSEALRSIMERARREAPKAPEATSP